MKNKKNQGRDHFLRRKELNLVSDKYTENTFYLLVMYNFLFNIFHIVYI